MPDFLTPLRKLSTAKRAVLLTALLGVLAAMAGFALASTGVPAPTISSGPANPTAATTASFSFADSEQHVTFLCSLDGSPYTACKSPATYSGLGEGVHTFAVEAKQATGSGTSSPSSYTWRIDRTAPTAAISFPIAGHAYNATGWQAGCPGHPGACGTATDPTGVAAVAVAVRQSSTGRYWTPAGYTASSAAWFVASLSAPGAITTNWNLPLPLPAPDGGFTVYVRALDRLSNLTPEASPVTAAFTIKTSLPMAPTIDSGPTNPSTSTTATFTFHSTQSGVTFQCQLDTSAFTACTSPSTYTSLALGSHTFSVRAVDAAGNISPSAIARWTINSAQSFSISGTVSPLLYPGAAPRAIPLTLRNPSSQPIFVTALSVTVSSTGATGCSASWFRIAPSNVSATQTVQIPANGTVTLPAQGVTAPTIQMLDSGTNQNACQGVAVTLVYGGSAHS